MTGKSLFATTDWFSVTVYPSHTVFDPNSSILVMHPSLAENHGLRLVNVVKVIIFPHKLKPSKEIVNERIEWIMKNFLILDDRWSFR